MGTEAALCLEVDCEGTVLRISALTGWCLKGCASQTAFLAWEWLWLKAPMMRNVLAVSTSTHRW